MKTASKIFRFERHQLDLGRYELQRAGRRLPLSRLPMELLILLIERRGQLVTREEIVTHLWSNPDSVDVVQGINNAINRIRAVLNDDASKPRFIETVVGKGYRFIAEVEQMEVTPVPALTEESAPPLAGSSEARQEHSFELVPALPAPPTQPVYPRRNWLLPALAMGVFLAGSLVVLWWRSRPAPPARNPVFSKLTNNDSETRITAAAISADGRWLAYADSNGISLRVMQSGATHALSAPADLRVDHLAWFPDNLRLLLSGSEATTLKPQLWVVSVTGSPPYLLQDNARQGMPSPDGNHIAFTTGKDSEIWVENITGEEPRRVIMGQPNETFPVLLWSPDSKRLVYQKSQYNPKDNRNPSHREWESNYHWNYESAEISSGKVTASVKDIRFTLACMLADGRMLFTRPRVGNDFGSLDLWEVKTDVTSGAWLFPPRLLLSKYAQALELTASSDGTRMAAVLETEQPDIYVGDLQEPGPTLAGVRKLTFDTKDDYPHAWTRDSKSIIFESDREGHYHIYKQKVNERRAEAMTDTTGEEVMPQVSPDGNWILYTVMRDSLGQPTDLLLRVPVAGGNPTPIEIGGPLDEFRCPLFGSQCILRETKGHQEFVYYALDPVKGKGNELGRTPWLPHVLGDWDVSPDGSVVALPYHDPAHREIRLVSLRAGSERPQEREIAVDAPAALNGLTWAADGKGWYMAVQTNVGSSLLFYVSLSGASRLLRQTTGGTWGVPSPDGRKLAFVDHTTDSNVWLLH